MWNSSHLFQTVEDAKEKAAIAVYTEPLDPETAKQGFIGLAEIMVSILAFMGVSSAIAKKGGDIS